MTVSKSTAKLTIGEAVKRMHPDFPGLSISKVRYLEDRGLINFHRSKGGYRKFDEESLMRLKEILRLQKEHFYPLDVIKQRMKHWRPGEQLDIADSDDINEPKELVAAVSALGLSGEEAKALENFGLIKPTRKGDSRYLSPADIRIAKVYIELSKFGIEPRHLRPFVNASERQVLLYEQVLSPVRMRGSKDSHADLERLVRLGQKLSDHLCRRTAGIPSA